MSRNLDFERRWLRDVALTAGYHEHPEDFFHAVDARLAKGAGEYGDDSFLAKSVVDLLDEALEEGVDFPAWLVVTIQRFHRERGKLEKATADHFERMLMAAAAKVVEGWHIARMARTFYEDHAREAGQ